MCGICAIVGDGATDQRLGRMLETIVHRGPDGEGRFVNGDVAAGMRRLAIIDLAGGDQPIFNEDRTHRDGLQRRDLQLPGAAHESWRAPATRFRHPLGHRGHRARLRSSGARGSSSGCAACSRSPSSTGRDRLGCSSPETGSGRSRSTTRTTAGRLLDRLGDQGAPRGRPVPADVDEEALGAYLALRYVPAPRTMFRRRHGSCPAGHAMRVSRRPSRASRRWWRLELRTEADRGSDPERLAAEAERADARVGPS